MNNEARLKELEREISQLKRELIDTDQVVSQMIDRRKEAKLRLDNLEAEAKKLKPRVLEVTDHAVMRYAERHHGFDFNKVRNEMSERLTALGDFVTDGKVAGFVIKGNRVITYIP